MRKNKLRRFEPLESRLFLTCAPTSPPLGRYCWQNEELPADVNYDGFVAPLDALLVINELEERRFADPETGELPSDGLRNRSPQPTGIYDFDVNGDDVLSPVDALQVVNSIGNVPILDMNGEGIRRHAPHQTLEWNSDSTLVMPPEFELRGGSVELHRTVISWDVPERLYGQWPNLKTPDVSVSVDLGGTSIQTEYGENRLILFGTDSLENYRRVLASLELHATDSGERYGTSVLFRIAVVDGNTRTLGHARIGLDGSEQQLVGQSFREALEWVAGHDVGNIRIIEPGDYSTADFQPDRLTIYVDHDDFITGVDLG